MTTLRTRNTARHFSSRPALVRFVAKLCVASKRFNMDDDDLTAVCTLEHISIYGCLLQFMRKVFYEPSTRWANDLCKDKPSLFLQEHLQLLLGKKQANFVTYSAATLCA